MHRGAHAACNGGPITGIFQRQISLRFAAIAAMKATLYEALGIPQAASDEEVRAALRRLIRKYYAKTRDGQGNVEEALRFINHASRILSDIDHRQRYDQELAVTTEANTEQRIAHFVSNVAADAGTGTATQAGDDVIDIAEERVLTTSDTPPEKMLHHPGLTERVVASFGRSVAGRIALCLLFGAFIAGAIVFVTPADAVLVAKQVLVWLTLTLLVLAMVYGVVHGIAFLRRRRALPAPALVPQTDIAILNWRREKSVFLGTDAPQEDASWIFQLRMAELERAKAGRTSEPRPWNRLAARLFDYAIWGLMLALLLSELHGAGSDQRPGGLLGRPSACRADPHHRDLGADRGAVDRGAAADPGQVAVRRLPAVLDQRCLRAARRAGAAQARTAPRLSRLVGRHRLRISPAGADPDRGSLRDRSRRTAKPTGISPRTAWSRIARLASSTSSPGSSVSPRCFGSTASPGTNRWPSRSRWRRRRSLPGYPRRRSCCRAVCRPRWASSGRSSAASPRRRQARRGRSPAVRTVDDIDTSRVVRGTTGAARAVAWRRPAHAQRG